MKNAINVFLIFSSLLLLNTCNDDNEIVRGHESYRYELWKLMVANNYQFDLIGTYTDRGSYPQHLGQEFDRDHQGVGGIETEGVLADIDNFLLAMPTPDIVLLGVGGNDIAGSEDDPSEPISNISQIIDKIRDTNPNVIIFLEQIAPGRADLMTNELQGRWESFNSQIVTLAKKQTDSSSAVIVVDMYTDFSNDYFADEVHYNEQGAIFVANQYFEAIQSQFDPTQNLNILTLGDSRVEGFRK
ncbi:MAG: hypothetical protein HC921_16210 [Synechococcaceae cyanobacterium SM2_3_1]|nr:hypothetical protein [Synechococcaceae cyanobacterium SM2_3_1]